MPHYQVINELPDLSFRTPVGKCRLLCARCLARKYKNEPPRIGPETMRTCESCKEVKTCGQYEAKRLEPITPKKRVKAIPVAERFDIIVRRKR